MRKIIYILSVSIIAFFIPIMSALAGYQNWTPYGGETDVNREYSYNRMIWNDTSGFGSTGTYEHETIVYNAGFARPASGGYWSSNLPHAYKDTRFGDNIDNFTVGSASAINIQRYSWYYTYYDLQPENPNVTSSTVRINGQRGHRWPSWCYSTWCIYADETYGLVQFTAPAGLSWYRH